MELDLSVDRADKTRHDRIVKLVDRVLELNKKKHSGKPAPSEIERLERDLAAADAEIDNLSLQPVRDYGRGAQDHRNVTAET